MAFETLADFINMGGHGIYVWPAFVISISLLKLLLWNPLWQERQLLKKVRQQLIREKNHPASEEI